MDLKRPWVATIVTVLVLFVVGPSFPGAEAQKNRVVNCLPGWDWVRSSTQSASPTPLLHAWCLFVFVSAHRRIVWICFAE